MDISKEIWKEIKGILSKYGIPYTSCYKSRDIETAMEYSSKVVHDKYIQINLVIPDYLGNDK